MREELAVEQAMFRMTFTGYEDDRPKEESVCVMERRDRRPFLKDRNMGIEVPAEARNRSAVVDQIVRAAYCSKRSLACTPLTMPVPSVQVRPGSMPRSKDSTQPTEEYLGALDGDCVLVDMAGPCGLPGGSLVASWLSNSHGGSGDVFACLTVSTSRRSVDNSDVTSSSRLVTRISIPTGEEGWSRLLSCRDSLEIRVSLAL